MFLVTILKGGRPTVAPRTQEEYPATDLLDKYIGMRTGSLTGAPGLI